MKTVAIPTSVDQAHPDYGRERYSVDEAAAYLLVHVTRIYRDAAAGRLAHRRDGVRRLRFSQADLDAWRAARRREVTDATEKRTAHRAFVKSVVDEALRPAPVVVRQPLPMPARRRLQ